jgi:hypothetical protein
MASDYSGQPRGCPFFVSHGSGPENDAHVGLTYDFKGEKTPGFPEGPRVRNRRLSDTVDAETVQPLTVPVD